MKRTRAGKSPYKESRWDAACAFNRCLVFVLKHGDALLN